MFVGLDGMEGLFASEFREYVLDISLTHCEEIAQVISANGTIFSRRSVLVVCCRRQTFAAIEVIRFWSFSRSIHPDYFQDFTYLFQKFIQ